MGTKFHNILRNNYSLKVLFLACLQLFRVTQARGAGGRAEFNPPETARPGDPARSIRKPIS